MDHKLNKKNELLDLKSLSMYIDAVKSGRYSELKLNQDNRLLGLTEQIRAQNPIDLNNLAPWIPKSRLRAFEQSVQGLEQLMACIKKEGLRQSVQTYRKPAEQELKPDASSSRMDRVQWLAGLEALYDKRNDVWLAKGQLEHELLSWEGQCVESIRYEIGLLDYLKTLPRQEWLMHLVAGYMYNFGCVKKPSSALSLQEDQWDILLSGVSELKPVEDLLNTKAWLQSSFDSTGIKSQVRLLPQELATESVHGDLDRVNGWLQTLSAQLSTREEVPVWLEHAVNQYLWFGIEASIQIDALRLGGMEKIILSQCQLAGSGNQLKVKALKVVEEPSCEVEGSKKAQLIKTLGLNGQYVNWDLMAQNMKLANWVMVYTFGVLEKYPIAHVKSNQSMIDLVGQSMCVDIKYAHTSVSLDKTDPMYGYVHNPVLAWLHGNLKILKNLHKKSIINDWTPMEYTKNEQSSLDGVGKVGWLEKCGQRFTQLCLGWNQAKGNRLQKQECQRWEKVFWDAGRLNKQELSETGQWLNDWLGSGDFIKILHGKKGYAFLTKIHALLHGLIMQTWQPEAYVNKKLRFNQSPQEGSNILILRESSRWVNKSIRLPSNPVISQLQDYLKQWSLGHGLNASAVREQWNRGPSLLDNLVLTFESIDHMHVWGWVACGINFYLNKQIQEASSVYKGLNGSEDKYMIAQPSAHGWQVNGSGWVLRDEQNEKQCYLRHQYIRKYELPFVPNQVGYGLSFYDLKSRYQNDKLLSAMIKNKKLLKININGQQINEWISQQGNHLIQLIDGLYVYLARVKESPWIGHNYKSKLGQLIEEQTKSIGVGLWHKSIKKHSAWYKWNVFKYWYDVNVSATGFWYFFKKNVLEFSGYESNRRWHYYFKLSPYWFKRLKVLEPTGYTAHRGNGFVSVPNASMHWINKQSKLINLSSFYLNDLLSLTIGVLLGLWIKVMALILTSPLRLWGALRHWSPVPKEHGEKKQWGLGWHIKLIKQYKQKKLDYQFRLQNKFLGYYENKQTWQQIRSERLAPRVKQIVQMSLMKIGLECQLSMAGLDEVFWVAERVSKNNQNQMIVSLTIVSVGYKMSINESLKNHQVYLSQAKQMADYMHLMGLGSLNEGLVPNSARESMESVGDPELLAGIEQEKKEVDEDKGSSKWPGAL